MTRVTRVTRVTGGWGLAGGCPDWEGIEALQGRGEVRHCPAKLSANQNWYCPANSRGLSGELLGLSGEPLGLSGEPLWLSGEPLGLSSEPLGLSGEPFRVARRTLGVVRRTLGVVRRTVGCPADLPRALLMWFRVIE